MGPAVEITPLTVFSWLLDPDFYAALPLGCLLTPAAGREAYFRVVRWALDTGAADPSAPGLADALGEAYENFAQAVAAVAAIDRRDLAPLKDFTAAQLGYQPEWVRLYYRDADGKPRKTLF